MVDRRIVYTGQIPLDTDVLQPQRNTMIGLGALAQAILGEQAASPAVAVDGFALAATGPASLILNVGPGSIYAQGVVDQSAFGSLPADITDSITLQGITLATTSLTFTPPGTVGFATNYLVQIALSVQDGVPIVLPYFNAANPPVPWLGPNNTGVSQNTVRQCVALIQAKAGVAASAGAQITPAPDPGFFGLYSVTVANGATALTSGNWATVANAPFVPSTLMAMPASIQSNKWLFSEDTGTANALVATLNPPPPAIIDGMKITVEKGPNPNTGPATLTVNGVLAAIRTLSGIALSGGEMPGNAMLDFVFDGIFWQIQTVNSANAGGPLYDGDATGTNSYTVSNLTPAASGLTNRMMIKITFANPNTSASSLNIGFGAKPIVFATGVPLVGGEITSEHILAYNTANTSWVLLTPTVVATTPPPVLTHYGPDTSVVVNTIAVNVTPAITSYGVGHFYNIQNIQFANTAGVTANFNSIGTRVVAHLDGTALAPGELQPGQSLILVDSGAQLQVVNKSAASFKIQKFIVPGAFVYNPTAGMRTAFAIVTGGGGSGGCSGAVNNAEGGWAGATAFAQINLTGPISGTVGAGGAQQTTQLASGNPGGTTNLDSFASAQGGPGGAGPGGAVPAAPATGTIGDILAPGNAGQFPTGGNQAGFGAGSFWGGGGAGGSTVSAPGQGALGGGGGAGEAPGGVSSPGAKGGDGVVFIMEFP